MRHSFLDGGGVEGSAIARERLQQTVKRAGEPAKDRVEGPAIARERLQLAQLQRLEDSVEAGGRAGHREWAITTVQLWALEGVGLPMWKGLPSRMSDYNSRTYWRSFPLLASH
jgi:hypothetical protein